MNDEKWQFIIGHIKDNFELISHITQDLPEEAGPGTVEIVEFKGPLGLMRLERTTQPLVIDKKTIGSRRIGSHTEVQYIYSDTEKIHKLKIFRQDPNGNDWLEVEQAREEMLF